MFCVFLGVQCHWPSWTPIARGWQWHWLPWAHIARGCNAIGHHGHPKLEVAMALVTTGTHS